MVGTKDVSLAYRVYVLVVVLLTCSCNLGTRNLPSYLIIVPVPECESVCSGVLTEPLCGNEWLKSLTGKSKAYQDCQECRAGSIPYGTATPGPGINSSAIDNFLQVTEDVRLTRHRRDSSLLKERQGSLVDFEERQPARGGRPGQAGPRAAVAPLPAVPPAAETETAPAAPAEAPVVLAAPPPAAAAETATAVAAPAAPAATAATAETPTVAAAPVAPTTAPAAPALATAGSIAKKKKVSKAASKLPVVKTGAAFYNIGDDVCLYNWEYGVLIGYGFALVFAVASLPAGWVCDRRPRVVIAAASLMAWSVATSVQAAGHSFGFMLGCRAVVGFSQAFGMPASMSLIADYFTDQPGLAISVLSVGGAALGAGSASFSALLAEFFGWRWAVLLAGLAGILLAPLLFYTIEEPERTEWSAPCAFTMVTEEVFEKSRVARMLIVAASSKMLVAYSLGAFLPIWFSRRGLDGYSLTAFACWNALIVASGGLVSAIVGGGLSAWWSERDPRAPCLVGLLGSITSMPLACGMLLSTDFRFSMGCYWLLVLASETWFGPTIALLQASVRRSVRGQAVSIFLSSSTFAANLGPAMIGFIDPGDGNVGMSLLVITLLFNVIAAAAFLWTALEISVDPVAAGFGLKAGGALQDAARRDRTGSTIHWALF